MLTDRELLEKAAKAAGINILYGRLQNYPVLVTGKEKDGDPVIPWNPLTDDGDALRLAVKLRLSVEHHNDVSQPHPWLRVVDRKEQWTHAGPSPEFNSDPYAATRRAIVRAAAAIGEQA